MELNDLPVAYVFCILACHRCITVQKTFPVCFLPWHGGWVRVYILAISRVAEREGKTEIEKVLRVENGI